MTIGNYFLLFLFLMQINNTLSAQLADLKIKLPTLKTSMGTLGGKLKDFSQKLDTLKASLQALKKTKAPTGPVGSFDQKMLNDFAKILEKTDQFDEKVLEKMAETDGYGYKTSNLQLMKDLVGDIYSGLNKEYKKTGFTVRIPEFCGIPSQEIQDFLLKKLKIDIIAEWKKVTAGINDATAKKAFENKEFPANFLVRLKALETKVEQAFDNFLPTINTKPSFNNTDFQGFNPTTILDLNNLLGDFTQSKFMVRSTAKEDTDKLANAGGNESVANVTPTVLEITKALKIVIASYFGSKSATQRLGAGDQSLFKDDPFTPALVQRMIGETTETLNVKNKKGIVVKIKGKTPGKEIPQIKVIPACGVMFTEEAEGGISKSGEMDAIKKRIKTTGISLIQAAFGHNEGVVNSIVAVDTYYVDETGAIFPVLREKNFRMAPGAIGKLEQVENPRYLKKTPALTFPAVYALKLFAMTLEHYYKKPMDVEFVVDYSSNPRTIYIVQARPIVHNKEQINPSYLTDIPSDALKTSVIGAAGGALQLILDKGEIIVKTRLPEALEFYQNGGCDPKKIKCIVVKEMAPATSHEATTFRSELKPVLACNNINLLEEWVEKIGADSKIIIDTQQGIIRIYNGPTTKIDDFIGDISAKGWIQYPVPQLYSVRIWDEIVEAKLKDTSNDKDLFGKNDQASVKNIIAKLNDKDTSKELPLKAIIKTIKTGTTQDAKCNLEALAGFYSQSMVKAQESSKDKSASFIEELKLWNKLFFKTALYVDSLLKFPSGDTDNFSKRLFAINFLEALLKQQPVALSLDIASFATHQSGLQKLKGNPAPTRTGTLDEKDHLAGLMVAAEYASDDTIETNWKNFIQQTFSAATLEETKKSVLNVIGQLSAAGIFPLWLNMTFKKPQASKAIITEYDASLNSFKTLAAKMKKLEAFDVAPFEDPKSFDVTKTNNHWKRFNDEFLTFFNNEFVAIMQDKKTSDLAKVYGTILMDAFVDKFDLAIKAVKGSNKYKKDANTKTNDNQFFIFQTMVREDFSLLKTWLPLIPEILGAKQYNQDNVTTITQTIEAVPLNETQTKSSDAFNVSAAIIGNNDKNIKNEQLPKTLEDIFTVSHQSLLNIISITLKPYGEKIQKPKLLEIVLTELTKTGGPLYDTLYKKSLISLIGFNFSGNTINYFYNYTLREHSGKLKVSFNRKTKSITFSLTIIGNDEQGRFHKVPDFIKFAADFYGYQLEEALGNKSALNVSFTLKKEDLEDKAKKIHIGTDQKTKLESIAYTLRNCGNITYVTNGWTNNELNEQSFFESSNWGGDNNFKPSPLIANQAEKIRAIETIIKLSLSQGRVHWLLPEALKVLTKSPINQPICTDLITILEKLHTNEKSYAKKSELFLFRRASDTYGGQTHTQLAGNTWSNILRIGAYYYTINDDNYLAKKAEIIKYANAKGYPLYPERYENVYQKGLLDYLDSVKMSLDTKNSGKFNSLPVPVGLGTP